jgi:hypothetical protein
LTYLHERLCQSSRTQQIALINYINTFLSKLQFDGGPRPPRASLVSSKPSLSQFGEEISAAVSLQQLSQLATDAPIVSSYPPSQPVLPPSTQPPSQSLARTTRRKRRSYSESHTLLDIQLALSPTVGPAVLQSARDAFFDRILALDFTLKKDNRDTAGGFTQEEATEITNFFFTEIMGPNACTRLGALVKSYNRHKEEETDIRLSARADTLARDESTYPPIRQFYRTLARARRYEFNTQTPYASFLAVVDNVQLYEQWEQLRGLAKAKDNTLIAFLSSNGYYTKPGVDYRSLVNQYLTKSLDLSSTTILINICQAAQGISELSYKFSKGVVVLLPPGIGN